MVVNIAVRDVSDELFRELKALAAQRGTSVGQELNQALSTYLSGQFKRKKKLRFLDLEPWDWGPGNERASMEIDETLYGGSMPK